MKLILFLIMTLFISSSSFAQDLSMVSEGVSYKTEGEKELFTTAMVSKTSVSIIPLLMDSYEPSSVSVNEANARIDHAVKFISENFMKSKTDSKRIKKICHYVHQEFLYLYQPENSFSEIFENGNYNSVSASALYAVIFSRLGIPYVVKEVPTHVFLIAYPGTSNLQIETTSRDFVYHSFSESFVEKYVEQLVKEKQISQKEQDTSSVKNIFTRHFYDKEIDLLKLSALQFANYGVYFLNQKNYPEAIEWFKRAYLIYPSERTSFVLKNALSSAIASETVK